MSGINNNDSDPSDPSTNPYNQYSLAGIKYEIDQIMAKMKSGNFDPTLAISHVLGDINGLQGNIVSADAAAQTAMSGYISQMADMQGDTANGNGTPVPDINPSTGQEYSPPQLVAPEVAVGHKIDYIENSIASPFELDSSGKPIRILDKNNNPLPVLDDKGKPVLDPKGNPEYQYKKNNLYSFYLSNPAVGKSLISNLQTYAASISAGANPPVANPQTGTPGYFEVFENSEDPHDPRNGQPLFNPDGTPMMKSSTSPSGPPVSTSIPDGKLIPADPNAKPPTQDHYDGGAIANIWAKAKGNLTATPPVVPDPSLATAMQSAAGTTSATLTSGSSAVEAVAKNDVQMYQTGTGAVNNTYMSIMNFVKAMVKGQSTQ